MPSCCCCRPPDSARRPTNPSDWRTLMLNRSIGIVALMAAVMLPATTPFAQDAGKYPDWSGQWKRPPGAGIQWDQTKPLGPAQQPPLTPEYQARYLANLADQAE